MSYPPTTPGVVQLSYEPGRAIQYWEALFTEAGAHTYTATIPIPPGATVLDVLVSNQVLWAAASSASLTVGDDVTANCFIAATNVKTTPSADTTALQGKDFLAAGTAGATKRYPNGGNIKAVITSVGAGAAGQTTVGCLILLPSYEVPVVLS